MIADHRLASAATNRAARNRGGIVAALFVAALAFSVAAPAAAQQFPITLGPNTVYGRLGVSAGPGQAIPFATLAPALGVTSNAISGKIDCGIKADGSTDDSAAWANCISDANSRGNTTIIAPVGTSVAPTLAATVSGVNVWIVCAGGPGTCILKGTANGMLTWSGAYGGTLNMGFDNAGANTNTTVAVNSFGTQFINPFLGTGISNFLAMNSVNGSTILVDGAFGAVRCDGGLPLFVANFGAGLSIRNSTINGNCSAGSVSGGRTFLSAENSTFDTIIVQNNLVQIFDYPIKVTAGTGVTIQDIFLSGNVWDNMQHGLSFTANGTGVVASVNLLDKWLSTTVASNTCLSLLGTGTIQGVVVGGKFGICGLNGILASVTTLTDAKIDQVSMDGLNANNGTASGINLAGGSGYSNIQITNSSNTNINSTHAATNGITIGAAIDRLIVAGNDFSNASTPYNGMLAGTTATFSHTNTVQRANVGLIDAPGYVNGGAFVTPTANGQISLGASATNGAIIGGQGSAADVSIANKSGTILCQVGTGTTTLTCTTLSLTNPLAVTNGGTGCAVAAVGCLDAITGGTISSAGSASILTGTAIPAGGTAGSGYKLSSTTNFGTFFGSGAPTLTAAQGSLYLRSDGGSLTRLYVNTNGTTGYSALPVATDIGLLRYVLTGVNFNSGNTDNAITITLPPGIARWRLNGTFITNASASISTATAGVFTGAGGTGQTINATQALTVTATAADTNNNVQNLAPTNQSTMAYTDTTVFFRVVNPQGSAATADVVIDINPMN